MADPVPEQLEDAGLKEVVREMPPGRKLAAMGVVAMLVGGLVALVLWINQPVYQVLFSGLTEQDAAEVVAKLKEMKVPYKIAGGGSVIKVPSEKVYEVRLALASQGLPRGGGVGFEIFNNLPLGTTEFVQHVNYQRALQGELARTIASFSEVEQARVHIVLPRESLFVEEAKKPSAAVVVKLVPGRRLSKRQVAGIVHLVASAVPELTEDRVTVVDTQGNLLYSKRPDSMGDVGILTATQLEYQRKVEAALAEKVETMLERVLGPGRAVVRVSADIDFTSATTTEDLFNPDQVAVRSETRSSDVSTTGGQGPIGSPDQRFNLAQRNAAPGAAAGAATGKSKSESETINYEISRTQRRITKPMGEIKRLSVAVVVDGPYKVTKGPGGQSVRTFTPMSAEQLRQITELVRRAVGYNASRGDQVTVANVPFSVPTQIGVAAAKGWQDYLREYGRPMVNLLVALLFILLVARPALKMLSQWMAARKPQVAPPARRVGPAEELPEAEEEAALLEELKAPRRITVRDQILALAQQEPDKATAALRAWIHEAG